MNKLNKKVDLCISLAISLTVTTLILSACSQPKLGASTHDEKSYKEAPSSMTDLRNKPLIPNTFETLDDLQR